MAIFSKHFSIYVLILISFNLKINCSFSDITIFKSTASFDRWINKDEYHNPYKNGEYNIAFKLIKNHDTFFDVGASFGAYTNTLAKKLSNLTIYAFEPVPLVFSFLEKNIFNFHYDRYPILIKNWYNYIKKEAKNINNINSSTFSETEYINPANNVIHLINKGVSNNCEPTLFNFDPKRPSVGGFEDLAKSTKIRVEKTTIDTFCEENNVDFIHYLKIDTEGHDFFVIQGAEQMLKMKKINYIQFEYIARCKKAHWNLKMVYDYLKSHDYTLYKIISNGLVLIDEWRPSLENFIYANFLAVSNNI